MWHDICSPPPRLRQESRTRGRPVAACRGYTPNRAITMVPMEQPLETRRTGSRVTPNTRNAVTLVAVLLAAAFTGVGLAGSPSTQMLHSVDTGLCPFGLDVKVTRKLRTRRVGASSLQILGPTTITLRNTSTGRTVVLDAPGSSSLNPATGSLTFSGRQLWLGTGNHVPYLSTDGRGAKLAPSFVISGTGLHPRAIDPCALVAAAPPSTQPVTTPAPWRLPAFALSQIAYAGLTPVIGNLVRHDHVHLDLIVDGRKITIPAGVGHAEPVDIGAGRCPPPPESLRIGDCAPGHFFVAKVALSPLHPHSTSGIVHIESDRPGRFTLGQFFDQWGVRFDSSCVGGYCAGDGKELRVFVDGHRVPGDPRRIVLADREEIAVVFGGAGDFGSVPRSYGKRWPAGCGGPGGRSCLP
jgi:hypothetical protein